ncbi:MarR family transcriptional regulator [Gordonia sp. ABSL1-1]|uniref:MarR family winged helix-turn-helix transcriptional regulator n=1 Tax=Gordonia sp. ABSL1-1 TaxID=3053923 RepID=UPI0025724E9A|nr:MarR family transcriptional regulator [Gordonia sp. ABSL1-1]MDL9936758.1 MarR family transcriptional regulator [Gordonia sp. ABSL1-1]
MPPERSTATADAALVYHRLAQITRALRTRGGQGGLTAGAAATLWTIVKHSPIRLSALAQRESVTPPTMSRIVASLEEQGLVERTVDPDDARARLFSATEVGVELIGNARSARASLVADALERLSEADRTTVGKGLALLADAFGLDEACIYDIPAGDAPAEKTATPEKTAAAP